jgi:hypothetical protein
MIARSSRPPAVRRVLGLLAVLASAGCFAVNDPVIDDATTQTWQFTAANGNIVTVDCLPGGACDYSSGAWVSNFGGCVVRLNFDVQFSGSSVRLLLFRQGSGTTCSGVQQTANGTGTANASYPSASQASGSSSINYTSPLGPAGGTATWSAARVG